MLIRIDGNIRRIKVPQIYGMIQSAREAGMTTLDQSLDGLVSHSLITRETAQALAVDPANFE